ncbi:hypothetical protein V5799_024051 [Amblyomma americanum]|uniref:Uncharacterized protein n=1 Tax=Amblyomma americanum TaxID=6943 RepID=A0AAQ4ED44_AMBAM
MDWQEGEIEFFSFEVCGCHNRCWKASDEWGNCYAARSASSPGCAMHRRDMPCGRRTCRKSMLQGRLQVSVPSTLTNQLPSPLTLSLEPMPLQACTSLNKIFVFITMLLNVLFLHACFLWLQVFFQKYFG